MSRTGETNGLFHRMEAWNGLGVVSTHDEATAAWIFIALHDDTLGPPVGGTRIKVYPRPEDGLLDAQRLAEGMTHKWAAIELGFGGGKAVIALSRPVQGAERGGLLERYGRLVEILGGMFSTGQDLGTTPDDMLAISKTCSYVHGLDAASGRMIDPGPYTALGVYSGIEAALARAFGSGDPGGRLVLVQGVGGVGLPLAERLAAAGATLVFADADEARAEAAARRFGGRRVPAAEVYDTACDVYAPCAVGQTLNRDTVPRLRCRIVAGSANNQLGEPADAERLHERGILYAPDFVINAGGAAAFGLKGLGESDETVIESRLRDLGRLLREIFDEAATRHESPYHAARRRIERVLSERRRH